MFSEWGSNDGRNSQEDPEIHFHLEAHWVLEAPVEQRKKPYTIGDLTAAKAQQTVWLYPFF